MKKSAERSGQPDLGKKRDAPSAVAWDGCAIAEDEPPAFVALLLGDFGQQTVGLPIGERKQGQFVVSVDGGDDPRRPTAEPSATGIEENRAREWELRGDTRARVLCHPQDYASPRLRGPAVRHSLASAIKNAARRGGTTGGGGEGRGSSADASSRARR